MAFYWHLAAYVDSLFHNISKVSSPSFAMLIEIIMLLANFMRMHNLFTYAQMQH